MKICRSYGALHISGNSPTPCEALMRPLDVATILSSAMRTNH